MRGNAVSRFALALLFVALASPAAATPLHDAAVKGHAAAVSALLVAGADPNARASNGATPLHIAAKLGHAAIVSALRAAGAD